MSGPFVGNRNVSYLNGIDQTVGTDLTAVPPERDILVASFNAYHKGTNLTVGGRALTKHIHRNGNMFWGTSLTGGPEKINKRANEVLDHILDNVAWCNIYYFNAEHTILEIRESEGHGARWYADGQLFRGFVEPQMADGHARGWVSPANKAAP